MSKNLGVAFLKVLSIYIFEPSISVIFDFLLYSSMNYSDFSVKSKLIMSLFQTVKLSLSISLFQKIGFS